MPQASVIELETVSVPASQSAEILTAQSDDGQPTSTYSGSLAPVVSQNEPLPENTVTTKATAIIIFTVTSVMAIGSFITGIMTVAIPTIAQDTGLDDGLLLWPASIYSLVAGCTLLLAGSMSDAVGSRLMYLTGCFLQAIFTVAVGLAKNGNAVIAFQALRGLAFSACVPSSVSIITRSIPEGKRRNIAFASMGGGQPVGFALGLALGGVFTGSIGWRWGFNMSAILNLVIFGIAYWGLPTVADATLSSAWNAAAHDVDWIGAAISSSCLALVSYVLASLTTQSSSAGISATNIVLLCISAALVPTFIYWMHRQVSLSRPALIPNSLWRSQSFTTICVLVLFGYGSFNGVEQLLTLYFQYVRQISPLDTSLRFLPETVSGILVNMVVGLLVHRISAQYIVVLACMLALAPSLLMALANPTYIYWAMEFPAVVLGPVTADVLFTISSLLITASFPRNMQGLAGGVFNTIAQIGKSAGLALCGVVASRTTARIEEGADAGVLSIHGIGALGVKQQMLLEGYRAAFWLCTAMNILCCVLGVVGLRKIGKVGLKRD